MDIFAREFHPARKGFKHRRLRVCIDFQRIYKASGAVQVKKHNFALVVLGYKEITPHGFPLRYLYVIRNKSRHTTESSFYDS
jgi:hypothetical protein